jgi:hypothetical protein
MNHTTTLAIVAVIAIAALIGAISITVPATAYASSKKDIEKSEKNFIFKQKLKNN